jgi:transcription elongation factor Elf1
MPVGYHAYMNLRFNCPTCLRRTLRATAGLVATSVHDLKCRKCGAKWRFTIQPLPVKKDGVVAMHAVTNTARIN